MSNPRKRLSPAEVDLMQALWQLGSATVTQLQSQVNDDREDPVSRNTIQVQLQRLENKGWVTHSPSGRVFVYEPTMSAAEGNQWLTREFQEKVFGGSAVAMVRCLVNSQQLSEDEMEELKNLIADKEEDA